MATAPQGVILLHTAGALSGAFRTAGGRPFLGWLLREMQRFGTGKFILLVPDGIDLSEQVRDLGRMLPRPAQFRCHRCPPDAALGAVLASLDPPLPERFWLCRADRIFDGNRARLLAAVHDRTTLGWMPAPPDAGLWLLDRAVLPHLPGSDPDDATMRLAQAGLIARVAVPGDTIAVGEGEAIPRRLLRAAVMLDRDGVINRDHGYVGTRDRFEWMPGILDAIRAATDLGRHVFVATNQSGIARGFYDEAQFLALHRWIEATVHEHGGTIDDVRFCPFHEDAAVPLYRRPSDWRKPAPGMLLDLVRAWGLDPARCLMVGDQPTDMQAAAAAGIAGQLFKPSPGTEAETLRELVLG